MKSFSFRAAGPRLPSIGQLFFLAIGWMFFSRLAGSGSIMDRALYGAAAGLGALALAASFRHLLSVERVSAVGDELVLELFVCGVPFGGSRRVRKADVLRAGLDKIEFRRWLRSDGAKSLVQSYPGWAVTLYCLSGPTQRTRLPLNDGDADALLSFVRGELGHD